MRWLIILFVVVVACSVPTEHPAPQNITETFLAEPDIHIEEWVTNLEVPWSLVFINSSHAIVSE